MVKKLIFRLLTVLIGCLLIFIVLEIGLRIFNPQHTGPVQFSYDPELGCIPVPHQNGRRTRPDYTFSNNSWGLRGRREYNKEKTADLRILFLGDSFTYGVGVNDEQVFTVLLEKNLTRPGRTVEVINAGMGGKGTDYALKFMQVRGLGLGADMVILCFNHTDFWDNERGEYYSINSDGSVSAKTMTNSICAKKAILSHTSFYNWLVNWSHFVNLIRSCAVKIVTQMEQGSAKEQRDQAIIAYPADYQHAGGYIRALTAKYIELLNKEIKKTGADFLIFYLGEWFEVDLYRKQGIFSDYENDFQAILKDRDMANFSTTAVTADSGLVLNDLYNIDSGDYHFSVNGHRLAADFIGDCLEKRLQR
jgi:lysophospholipase L1-like esterase